MVRKRVKARSEGMDEDIFAALERHGTHNFQEPPTARREASVDTTVAQLQAQITALTGQIDDMNRRSMMRPAPAPTPARQLDPVGGPQDVKLDLITGMPDPLDNIQQYNRAVQDRISAYLAAQQAVQQQTQSDRSRQAAAEQASQQQADKLWNDFSDQYPAWAEYGDIVKVVAQQVVEREQAKGVDGQAYILGNTPIFFRDVEAELQKRYGRLVEDQEEGEYEADPHEHTIVGRKGAPAQGFDDDGRTVGVMGGLESGGKPAGGRRSTEPAASDMITDLHQMQMKTGYY